MTHEIETKSACFTADHLLEAHAQHPEPEAMLKYTTEMAYILCDFAVGRFGPQTAYQLFQSLADKIIEQQKPKP